MPCSRLSGFHALSTPQRLAVLAREGWLLAGEETLLLSGASESQLETVSENVLGSIRLPRGIVTNVVLNGVDVLLPFATEEPSIVAACSKAALLAREGGGVFSRGRRRIALAQLLVRARRRESNESVDCQRLLASVSSKAQQTHPRWAAAGGRLLQITLESVAPGESLAAFTVKFDPCDSMGANLADSIASLLGSTVNSADFEVLTPIVSNHPVTPHLEAYVRIPVSSLGWRETPGSVVAERIHVLSAWAAQDPLRCTTHNKGVMNGIEALLTATYQDTRAASAALYAAAHESHTPQPLVRWTTLDGMLEGRFQGTIPCGIVGGTAPHMPETATLWRWMNVRTALDLEAAAASAGLLQNLGALRALATEGIETGHLRLHARKHGNAAS